MNSNNEVINILPIGDSITDGAGTHSGYRFFLHNLLYKSGINFRFAGPKKAHDPRMPERYYYHAGYGGNTIGPDNSRNGNVFSRLPEILKERIDIALLMLGRNNYFQCIDLDRIDEVYYNFIKEMLSHQPEMHIFVGSMNYSKAGNSPNDPALSGLNRLLPGVCDKLKNEGHNVYFVDIATITNLGPVDFKPYDNTHPNDIGQEKIAKAWFNAILPVVKELNKPDHNQIRIENFRLNTDNLKLKVNEEFHLLPIFTPSNPDEFTVLWSSSDNQTVKVDTLGRITALKEGKATIYGECLNGGFISSCDIEVSKAIPRKMAPIFECSFSDKEKWTGNVNYIDNNNVILWFIRSQCKINTVKKLTSSNKFILQFEYEVTDNKGKYFGTYTSLKFNGLEMRIYDGTTKFEVRYNDEILATHNSFFDIEARTYKMEYNNGKISLYKGGETIISVDKEIELSPSDIELYSNEGERLCIISNIKLFNLL